MVKQGSDNSQDRRILEQAERFKDAKNSGDKAEQESAGRVIRHVVDKLNKDNPPKGGK